VLTFGEMKGDLFVVKPYYTLKDQGREDK